MNQTSNSLKKFDSLSPEIVKLNIGGIPLALMYASENMSKGNCFLLSKWLLEAYPDSTFVMGSTKFFREIQKANEQSIIKGFHCWVEKDGYVYDSISKTGIPIEEYYTKEEVIVSEKLNKKELDEKFSYPNPCETKPTKRYSKFRLFLTLSTLSEILSQDMKEVRRVTKNHFNPFIEQLNIGEISTEFYEEFPEARKGGISFTNVVKELFINEKYNDEFQNTQRFVYNFINNQYKKLLQLGYISNEEPEEN